MSMLTSFLESEGWNIVDVQELPRREGEYLNLREGALSDESERFLSSYLSKGVYRHQAEAIEYFINGSNICLTTGTASGKSLIFYVGAIEKLAKNKSSKIISIYPLKALAREQEERWNEAIRSAGIKAKVGRIDGQVPIYDRVRIVRDSQILILTPDVIHAWFMYNLTNRAVVSFLANVSLVVVDEIHSYSGVFGSNAAYLFRRLRHVMDMLGACPQYIAASATIYDPESHLNNLFGVKFKIIGPDKDTSPRQGTVIKLIEPPGKRDLLSEVSGLMEFIAKSTGYNFITFVDSRKQTEYIASIVSRHQTVEEDEEMLDYDHLRRLNILPYRAGYEESDRKIIQDRLREGTLKGIVSTSALELGIDIRHLDLGILVGVPRSSTSLYQRIGRIGRHKNGTVLIVNSGDIYSEDVFRNPKRLMDMPLYETALYLENQRIQYIHALCLARQGGEHDQICGVLGIEEDSDFNSSVEWPKGFVDLCRSERIGIIPPELRSMKAQAGDDPNHTYPLRDVEVQFRAEYKRGPEKRFLGSLSYGQLMREAYPGAVYYYTTRPHRVYRVKTKSRIVEVRKEKRYKTKPIMLPTMVFPNLSSDNRYSGKRFGSTIIVESDLQIREVIIGFKEHRGPTEITIEYPLDPSSGIFFDQPRFARNYFTTGVIISSPVLNSNRVKSELIANLLFEAFLMIIPFERRDINFASDRYRVSNEIVNEGDRFICIYDQTYGSLRLSSRLLEGEILKAAFDKAQQLAMYDESLETNQETLVAMVQLVDSLSEQQHDLTIESSSVCLDSERFKMVIMPGSKGIDIRSDNEEFFIEGVFFSPVLRGLAYRGKPLSKTGSKFSDVKITVPVDSIREIPGESELGVYDYETGELRRID